MTIQNNSNGEIFLKDFNRCAKFYTKCGALYILADRDFLKPFFDSAYNVLVTYEVRESTISGLTIMFIRSID